MPVPTCLVLVLAWAPAAGRAATSAIAAAIKTNFRMLLPLSLSASHRIVPPLPGVRNPPFEAYGFSVLAGAVRQRRNTARQGRPSAGSDQASGLRTRSSTAAIPTTPALIA